MPARDQQFSSEAFDDAAFRAHGRTQVRFEGRVLHIGAWGPFNRELVDAQFRLLRAKAAPLIPADGLFFELISYHDSLLMPEDAWTLLEQQVDAGVNRGVCARATVMVIDPQTEGYRFFVDRLERIWSRSRPVLRATSLAQGELLLASVMGEAGC